jgi:hypothetical protein
MDPSWHCQSNTAPPTRPSTLTAYSTFSTATFLTYKDCNSVMLIACASKPISVSIRWLNKP